MNASNESTQRSESLQMDVSASVLAFAEGQGITLSRLLEMVEASARVTHPKGNRRHHNWVFQVENNVVKSMSPLPFGEISSTIQRVAPKPGPGEFLTYDECEDCEGAGCKKCDFKGDVPVIRKIPKSR